MRKPRIKVPKQPGAYYHLISRTDRFHILVHVPPLPKEPFTDEELLTRLENLLSARFVCLRGQTPFYRVGLPPCLRGELTHFS